MAKLFIQKLWQEKVAWDTPLNADLNNEWLQFQSQLARLEEVRVPRWLMMQPGIQSQLHGFCDASKKAYAAVIYLYTKQGDGQFTSRIVTSKTRLAPLHSQTIPRLELCAGQLLVRLMNNIRRVLNLADVPYMLWTDANIVLCWLRKCPSQLKQYVGSRVEYIQKNSDIEKWRHIGTKLNPADCASRGITASEIVKHKLWWQGPASQQYPIDKLHKLSSEELVAMEAEFKPVKVKVGKSIPCNILETLYFLGSELITIDLVERFSSMDKLLRTIAYILRWKVSHSLYRVQRQVSAVEISIALNWHILAEQTKYFSSEISQLKRFDALSTGSKLVKLSPFLDVTSYGELRMAGRLENADLEYNQRNPIILPHESLLSKLIVSQVHLDSLHGGIQQMLRIIWLKYWIPRARKLVKTCIHTCVICRRHNHIMLTQRMGSLPKARVTQAPPFARSGIDYCGPFQIRIGAKSVRTVKKTYVAIFICMATKAVHIELAEDLSSEAFMNLYTRFVNRRGPCTDLYSDNGTSFVGANRLMKEDLLAWHNEYTLQNIANKGTQWHFNPPGAPHHGGLWEAAVKSAKRHLLRIVGIRSIYYDQLHTLLVHVEACLNSRPLVALHDSEDDRLALTPADFLIGRPLMAVPDRPIGDIPTNKLSYWRQLKQMQQHFWQRWHNEYLTTLQSRSKWHRAEHNIKVGDIVIVRHENLPATHWRLGKVVALHPGRDGLIRVATIRNSIGECTRPVQKLYKLMADPEHICSAGQDV